MPETIVTGDPRRYLHMPMLTSVFNPSSELDVHSPSGLDTHEASPQGSSPARVPSSVWDCFEYPCLTMNQLYYGGNDVVLDTSDNFQNYLQQSPDDVDIQQALSPPMAFPLLEGDFLDGPVGISKATTSSSTHIPEMVFCNPNELSLTSQIEHRSAHSEEATGISDCCFPAGDIPAESSHVWRYPDFPTILDTLPDMELGSNIDIITMGKNICNKCDALDTDFANPFLYGDAATLPELVSSDWPLSPRLYQSSASVERYAHPPEEGEISWHSVYSRPQDNGSTPMPRYPYTLATTKSKSLSIPHTIDGSFAIVGHEQEAYISTTKRASSTGPDDTVRDGHDGHDGLHNCGFTSPSTKETCKFICSRIGFKLPHKTMDQ